MNLLNKAFLQLRISLYCLRILMLLLAALESNCQTFTGKLCDIPYQPDAFLATITWRKFGELLHKLGNLNSQHGALTRVLAYARVKFSRWNQSLYSSLSCGIPSGVYIICPIYGPGYFPYTCGQSHRGSDQYRDSGFIINSSRIFYFYSCSIYIFRPCISLHDISNKASLILEDKLRLFTPGVGQPWIGWA